MRTGARELGHQALQRPPDGPRAGGHGARPPDAHQHLRAAQHRPGHPPRPGTLLRMDRLRRRADCVVGRLLRLHRLRATHRLPAGLRGPEMPQVVRVLHPDGHGGDGPRPGSAGGADRLLQDLGSLHHGQRHQPAAAGCIRGHTLAGLHRDAAGHGRDQSDELQPGRDLRLRPVAQRGRVLRDPPGGMRNRRKSVVSMTPRLETGGVRAFYREF